MGRLRRSMLYVPGNRAAMVKDAHIYGPDTLMFDLEDSVPYGEKDAARLLVYYTLRTLDHEGVETAVRINGLDTPFGRDDIEAMVRARPDIIRIPKTDSPQDVQDVEELVEQAERRAGLEVGTIRLFAAVETPLGVLNARAIAVASRRLVGIALGAEDLVTNLRTTRSADGVELLFARSQVLFAARAAGIDAIDTVYSDLTNEQGFLEEVRLIKQLGFDGKSVIQPSQIGLVHQVYTPTREEVLQARRVMAAIREAGAKGSGVIALDGRMVDKPIVERARRVIDLALACGLAIEEAAGPQAQPEAEKAWP
jgi:citrate lyase subunit beta/citryl-CoA lyase